MNESQLPRAIDLFATFVQPWYPQERQGEAELRSDLEEIDLPDGVHIRELHTLEPGDRNTVMEQIARITEAALTDLPGFCGEEEGTLAADLLTKLEDRFDDKQILGVIQSSQPDDLANNWLVLCCEIGAYAGAILQRQQSSLQWIPDWPYWDSALFDLNTKSRVPVFHWAFKFLSGDEHRGIAEKIDATLQRLRTPE